MTTDAQLSHASSYARAFMNCCGLVFDRAVHDCVMNVIPELEKHRSLLFLLECARVEPGRRAKVIEKLGELCGLGEPYHRLLKLLIKKRRVSLLPLILSEICRIYRSQNKLVLLYIESSVELSVDQIAQCSAFFESETEMRPLVQTRIVPALIAGIRLRTEDLVWEYSLADRLRRVTVAAGC